MNIIRIIAFREFSTRVRKKSFLLITLLGPLIMAALLIVPLKLSMDPESEYRVLISDERGLFGDHFHNLDEVTFVVYPFTQEELTARLDTSNYQAALFFHPDSAYGSGSQATFLFTQYNASVHRLCELTIAKRITELKSINLSARNADYSLPLRYHQATSSGQSVKEFFSYGGAVLIYFFIFLYGIQVMKGVIEEKHNRIVEVMLTTVRPLDLMIGKIAGIGLLGLFQFVVWNAFVLTLSLVFDRAYDLSTFDNQHIAMQLESGQASFAMEMNQFLNGLQSINFPLYLSAFLFYFVTGYLFYGSLFAIVGAASDVDTETQQFILPITVPLLFAFLTVQPVINNPHGNLATTLSIVPFTSPITMLVRLPFAEDTDGFMWQLLLSMGTMILGFLFVSWVASRIYRVGILMYGQKAGYRELVKWFFSKR